VPPYVRELADRGRRERQAIATYLGHVSIQTTFDLYGHLMPGNEDEAVALVDAYLKRSDTGGRIDQLGASRGH
jgi:integrase